MYFDQKKEIVLENDASQGGLGSVLLQDGVPVARHHRSENIKTPRGLQARITGLLSRPSDHKPVGQQPSRRDVGVTACRAWTGHKRRNPGTSCHSNASDILVWLNINGQPSKRTSAIIDISIGTTECR